MDCRSSGSKNNNNKNSRHGNDKKKQNNRNYTRRTNLYIPKLYHLCRMNLRTRTVHKDVEVNVDPKAQRKSCQEPEAKQSNIDFCDTVCICLTFTQDQKIDLLEQLPNMLLVNRVTQVFLAVSNVVQLLWPQEIDFHSVRLKGASVLRAPQSPDSPVPCAMCGDNLRKSWGTPQRILIFTPGTQGLKNQSAL